MRPHTRAGQRWLARSFYPQKLPVQAPALDRLGAVGDAGGAALGARQGREGDGVRVGAGEMPAAVGEGQIIERRWRQRVGPDRLRGLAASHSDAHLACEAARPGPLGDGLPVRGDRDDESRGSEDEAGV